MKVNEKESVEYMKIISYHDGVAKKVAEMWNQSKDSWGGSVKTEEQVIEQQQSSDNLDTFLAMDGEEVVGYCGLSVYKDDIGALYVPLLNVRPDYHGKKIGKLLLLKALQEAIDRKWPRLDLYTWAGNLKAVPLYKRCGFFWEDVDSYTHLMNFIPSVLNNPLLASLMKPFDWYGDLKRQIEVKPDGELMDGFTFYEYVWEKEENYLKVKFERTGRGISYIETNDFLIEFVLPSHELIENREYPLGLKVKNKTKQPLTIEWEGTGTDRIHYGFSTEQEVVDSVVITESAFVKEGEEPEKGKTFPIIWTILKVNGRETPLSLGILPQAPLKIEAKQPDYLFFAGMHSFLEFEVENNVQETSTVMIHLPENKFVDFSTETYTFSLEAKEKKSFQLPIQLKQSGCFEESYSIEIKFSDNKSIQIRKEISFGFKGLGNKFVLNTSKKWIIYNGTKQISIQKSDNVMEFGNENSLVLFAPSLGKPFSNEWAKTKPFKVEENKEDNSILVKFYYSFQDFPNIEAIINVQLFAEGFVKRWITLWNKGLKKVELYAQETFYHPWGNVFFPLKNKIVEFDELKGVEPSDIYSKDITGNWYFSNGNKQSVGVAWDKDSRLKMDSWKMFTESSSIVDGLATVELPAMYISIGAFSNWKEWKMVAEGYTDRRQQASYSEGNLQVNGGNPIIGNDQTSIPMKLTTFKNKEKEGSLFINLDPHVNKKEQVKMEKGSTVISIDINPSMLSEATTIEASFETDSQKSSYKDIIFKQSGTISRKTFVEEGVQVFQLNNGVLEWKIAPKFFSGIYSLQVNGVEWIDNCFPTPGPKSWWNPWCGGIKSGPPDFNVNSLLKEERTCEFVEIKDIHQNNWVGIKVDTKVSKHTYWKGLHYSQYFVTMPGLPLVITFTRINNAAGKRMRDKHWYTNVFLAKNQDIVLHVNKDDLETTYYSANEDTEIVLNDEFFFSMKKNNDCLSFIASKKETITDYYSNKEVILLTAMETCNHEKEGDIVTSPKYFLFTKEHINESQLHSIKNIEFNG